MAETEKYIVFFSWQSNKKEAKDSIFLALRQARKTLLTEGIDLVIDSDTWDRVGKKNIENEVLRKISNCDIFVADFTPVCTIPGDEKENRIEHLQPNANVMFEYGYALALKGDERMILLANLEHEEYIEHLPFDINHDTITKFTIEAGAPALVKPIRKIIEHIREERAVQKPQYGCNVLFNADGELVPSATIHPKYKRIHYYKHRVIPQTQTTANKDFPENSLFGATSALTAAIRSAQKYQEAIRPTIVTPVVKWGTVTRNHALCPIEFVFINTGITELNNCEITIKFNCHDIVLKTRNKESTSIAVITQQKDYSIRGNQIHCNVRILNPNTTYSIDPVYVQAPADTDDIEIEWTMQSTRHRQTGRLTLHVEKEVEDEWEENEQRAGEVDIKPYIKEE